MANSITRSLILDEVARRGWRAEVFGDRNYFYKIVLPDGRSEIMRGSLPARSSVTGYLIAKHKHLSMKFMESMGYRIPAYRVIDADDQSTAEAFLREQRTVVVKPVDGHSSEGVTVGISSAEAMQAALAYARTFSGSGQVILQQHLSGKLYRLLTIDGRLVAAAHRMAPEVVGSGRDSVRDLILALNRDSRRGTASDTPLRLVDMQRAEKYLGADELVRVPVVGEAVRVAAIDSVSAGGEAINVTDMVHDDWCRVAGELARASGLFVCGYDVICQDISRPLEQGYIPLLEMNSMPGFKLHQYPTGGGESIALAPILLDALFK